MDLRNRLARLDRLTRRPADAGPAAPPDALYPDTPDASDAEAGLAALGLDRVETADGPVWRRDHVDDVAPPPDPLPDLGGLFTRDAGLRPAPGDVVLVDTETTGLAGGTGTMVFLVGLSWWEGTGLRTRQYFLPAPVHESAMLAALAGDAARFRTVVSFNGATFDLPLLRTRALLNRLRDPLRHLAGWDLLVPARRLWRHRLPDCRQQSVETHLTGVVRAGDDIDGSRIPQAWFDFLAGGGPGLLPNVLIHNHRDMIGMARILGEVCAVGTWLADPRAALPDGWADRTGAWALGRVCERRREPAAAARCFDRAWAGDWGLLDDAEVRRRFRRDAVRNLKRERRWELVEAVVADALDCDPADPEWHREAAVLYEHRLVDLVRARRHATLCGDPHRLARLDRRLAGPRAGDQDGGMQREDDA